MDDHVHVRHGPGLGDVLLAIELQWREILLRPQAHLLVQRQLALDEQAGRSAAGIVDLHARLRIHDPCHDHADLGGRVELPPPPLETLPSANFLIRYS